jgi:hypothetical protein
MRETYERLKQVTIEVMEGLLWPRPDFMHSETRDIVENALASVKNKDHRKAENVKI